MTKRRITALACVAVLLPACGDLLEPAAAVVDGEKIPESDVEQAVEDFRSFECSQIEEEGIDPQEASRRVAQSFLSQEIRRSILEMEAEKRDIEVTDDEVREQLERAKAELPSADDYEAALEEQCITEDQLLEIFYVQRLEEKVKEEITAELAPGEDDLRSYYNANIQRFRQVRASHILVGQSGRAEEIASLLRKAPKREVEQLLGKLARAESLDPATRENGGDLGYVTAESQLDPTLLSRIGNLAEGEISEPFQTAAGYEIVYVSDRRVVPFEEARAQIEQEVAEQEIDAAWTRWLQDAYGTADIEVNPAYGELSTESLQIVDPSLDDAPATDVTPTPSQPAPAVPGQ